jgi:hypothetical protein
MVELGKPCQLCTGDVRMSTADLKSSTVFAVLQDKLGFAGEKKNEVMRSS